MHNFVSAFEHSVVKALCREDIEVIDPPTPFCRQKTNDRHKIYFANSSKKHRHVQNYTTPNFTC